MFRTRREVVASYLILSLILLTGFMSRIENTDAAVLEVTVQTDHPTYNPGDTVPIRVHVTTSGGTVPVDDAEVFVSIIPPGGGAVGGLADLFGAPGWYTYEHALSPSAGGGVYTVKAQATRAGDTPGSAETTFTVTGAPAKKSVDWAVYNPSVTPANPTTEDPVRINVWTSSFFKDSLNFSDPKQPNSILSIGWTCGISFFTSGIVQPKPFGYCSVNNMGIFMISAKRISFSMFFNISSLSEM